MGNISRRIRQSKIISKEDNLQVYVKRVGAMAQKAAPSSSSEPVETMLGEGFNPYTYTATSITPLSPYNIDVTTETQAFILPPQGNSTAPDFASTPTTAPASGSSSSLPIDPSLDSFGGSSSSSVGVPSSSQSLSFGTTNYTDPMNPLTPMTPITPVNPMQSMNSSNFMNPMYSMNSMNSVNPMTPITPITPMSYMDPMNPMGYMGYMNQMNQMNQMNPMNQMNQMSYMNSLNPTGQMNQMGSTNWTDTMNPMGSMNQMGFMNQLSSMDQGGSTDQMGFMNQMGAMNSMNPITPVTPMSYVDPMPTLNLIGSTSPMDHMDLTNPVDSMNSTSQADFMSPINSLDPLNLANSMDPMSSTSEVDFLNSMDSTDSTNLTTPANMTNSMDSIDPIYPAEPMSLVTPESSMNSSNSADLMNSTGPVNSESSTTPAEQIHPMNPPPAPVPAPVQQGSSGKRKVGRPRKNPITTQESSSTQKSKSTPKVKSTPKAKSTQKPKPTQKSNTAQSSNQAQSSRQMDKGLMQQNRTLTSYLLSLIPLSDDDKPFLEHFINKVVRVVLPIPEIYPGNQTHVTEIVNSLQNNRAYLHCCLSASAIHLKASQRLDDQLDPEIMNHRYTAISQLSRTLLHDSGDMHALNGTLALIFYYSAVSNPDDYLPDISWRHHFTAVWNLVKKLDRPPSPFNVSLIAWIDILGSTMVGKTPAFSHTYRTKNAKGIGSGLERLMGCNDRLMYLISEIACLEDLIADPTSNMDEQEIRKQFAGLTAQLNWAEDPNRGFEAIYNPKGGIKPDKLTKLISGIFQLAARIYLYSVMPGFDYHDGTIMNLVNSISVDLTYIPSGPNGFDRCLAWPLFMAGVHSTPSSNFRRVLTERVAAMGYLAKFGSFGQMYRILKEVWVAREGPLTTPSNAAEPQPGESSEGADGGSQQPPPEECHWREVMKRKNWEFLVM
ncbi:hypothetical protein BO94DRAFT_178417 [Aspergillus sclerotioniger CBS 115572]|uniref:Uncharacterized protein n=1 Tax=Aspergillus sclerotioniger CBS 115572 TaxID=1450535 RepID=A0A317VZN3_9EURO|nr:hypothetical protein BO94DRAFT_178417 [Aspergillus sclerotioniger CBS 115572]PWY78472.1 hypothetical protein BO94DRAFT_178417 [Aspergillus sclerotioniger CBS 115572]